MESGKKEQTRNAGLCHPAAGKWLNSGMLGTQLWLQFSISTSRMPLVVTTHPP